jgi:hypothetical protein
LDITADYDYNVILINLYGMAPESWGDITLTGSLKGSIILQGTGRMDEPPLVVKSTANVTSVYNDYAIRAVFGVDLTVAGGTLKVFNPAYWDSHPGSVFADGKKTRVKITGGTLESEGDYGRALGIIGGAVVTISGATANLISRTPEREPVWVGDGTLELGGGTITPATANDGAVSLQEPNSALVFTGDTPPKLNGSIFSPFPGVISADSSFKPGTNKYKLALAGAAIGDSVVAVKGGGALLGSFSVTSAYYDLAEKDGDIIVKLQEGVTKPKYTITNYTDANGGNYYSGVGGGVNGLAGFSTTLQRIKEDANKRPCSIHFGSDTALNIGNEHMNFDGDGWGKVSLSGKIKTSYTGDINEEYNLLNISWGASVESNLDVINAMPGTKAVVSVGTVSYFTHKGGNLRASIYSGGASQTYAHIGGTVTLSGGTIGDTSISTYTIFNETGCQTIISDSAKIISADTSAAGAAIINSGTLRISGNAKVSSVKAGAGGRSVAVLNGVDAADTMAAVIISDSAQVSSPNASLSVAGVIMNRYGALEISGGKVFSTRADTSGPVIYNVSGARVKISGSAEISSQAAAFGRGVIYNNVISAGKDSALISADISGGKISAKAGYALYCGNSAKAAISGSAEVTSASPNGAVYLNPNSRLYLLGGTVSSTSKDTVQMVKAINMYPDGRGGGPGLLTLGGSPAVNGKIAIDMGSERSTTGSIAVYAAGASAFSPGGKKYELGIFAAEGEALVKNGAGFISNFILDTVSTATVSGETYKNSGFKLAANGNDAVATKKRTCNVAFNLNGSTGAAAPDAIPVLEDGTIGDLAKPSTTHYLDANRHANDGEWHISNGIVGGVVNVGEKFDFGDSVKGTRVKGNMTLTLLWTDSLVPVSVLASAREVPAMPAAEVVAVAPVAATAGTVVVGPNPVYRGAAGGVGIFWSGGKPVTGTLYVYNSSGGMMAALPLSGKGKLGAWDAGRAPAGTYLLKGALKDKNGGKAKVSLPVSVR